MPKRTHFTAAEWFSRYSRASQDMRLAAKSAELALVHHRETLGLRDERRTAYTLAFVVTYARPFTSARGWPDIQRDTLPYMPGAELALHARLLTERSELWAHTDAKHYEARAVRSPPFSVSVLNIEHQPLHFTAEDLERALAMIPGAIRHFDFMAQPYRAELFKTGQALEGWYEDRMDQADT